MAFISNTLMLTKTTSQTQPTLHPSIVPSRLLPVALRMTGRGRNPLQCHIRTLEDTGGALGEGGVETGSMMDRGAWSLIEGGEVTGEGREVRVLTKDSLVPLNIGGRDGEKAYDLQYEKVFFLLLLFCTISVAIRINQTSSHALSIF